MTLTRPREALPERRRLLAALGGAGLWAAGTGLVGCAALGRPGDPATDRHRAQAVAPGVYLLAGLPGDVGPENLGRIGNASFVVGTTGVLAVNAGVSRRDGEALLAAIRQTTPLPLRGLLLTHAMQEFIFGATAFQDAGVPILMHRHAARLMAGRCETCLKALVRLLGDEAMAGSRVPKADRPFDASDAASALPDIGRPLQLLAADALAASPGDSALFVPGSDAAGGTLIAGALLDADTIPDVQDSDLTGWHTRLAALGRLPVHHVIPGHGPAGPAAQIDGVERYLRQLEDRTAALLKDGTALSEVADATDLPPYAGWSRYDTTHRRNASIVYLRQERAMMLNDTSSTQGPPP
jgi:glyoxylase-like metal-dependent hydrolase (beta-lactamase superfamily II)